MKTNRAIGLWSLASPFLFDSPQTRGIRQESAPLQICKQSHHQSQRAGYSVCSKGSPLPSPIGSFLLNMAHRYLCGLSRVRQKGADQYRYKTAETTRSMIQIRKSRGHHSFCKSGFLDLSSAVACLSKFYAQVSLSFRALWCVDPHCTRRFLFAPLEVRRLKQLLLCRTSNDITKRLRGCLFALQIGLKP